MENGPLEDVFPIEHGDIPSSYVSLHLGNQEVTLKKLVRVYIFACKKINKYMYIYI